MDDVWERSIPLYDIRKNDIDDIFYKLDRSRVLSFKVINSGCRNSNYLIKTDSDDFVLRICPSNSLGYKNEIAISKYLHNVINIPRLLSHSIINDHHYLIYEYIEGESLGRLIKDGNINIQDYIGDIARSLAKLHSFDAIKDIGLIDLNLPPFFTWYDFFLDNDLVTKRLGEGVVDRIKQLVSNKKHLLEQIEEHKALIHSDFRPANMLLSLKQKEVYFVDWEFAQYGHTLADVGQFFRYRTCFTKENRDTFYTEYNKVATTPLPENWFELSILRDLVNPLQMIGSKKELPNKFKDLKEIIMITLDYFNF